MKTLKPRALILTCIAAAASTAIGFVAAAEPPGSLQDIMQQLDADTARLTSSLMTEDWAAMRASAIAIAEHPKVPMSERVKILSALGSEAATFRNFDTRVHDAATRIAEAASRHDLSRAHAEYVQMTDACIGCHNLFRNSIRTLRLESDATTGE